MTHLSAVPSRLVIPRAVGLRRAVHIVAIVGFILGPVLLCLFTFTRTGRTIRLVDEYFYHTHARSWYFDHNCDYANDLHMAPGFAHAEWYTARRSPTGAVFNHFPVGTALVSFPLIALADMVTIAHNALGFSELPRDGYSHYYQLLIGLGHTLLGVAGLLAGYRLTARYFPAAPAALAVLATWAGTAALYYIGYESPHSHAAAIGWIGLMLLATDTIRSDGTTVRRWAWLGFCTGMMVVTRPQDFVWTVVPAIVLAKVMVDEWREPYRRRSMLGGVLIAALLAAICYIPQALVNYSQFGSFIVNTYAHVSVEGRPATLAWTSPDFLRPIIDSRIGLLWTSPLALLAGLGTLLLPMHRRLTLTALLIGLALYYYAVSCIWWTFSGMGHRYLLSATIALAIGLAAVFTWADARRMRGVAVGLIVIVCIVWQMYRFAGIVWAAG